jgi:hypothetical protein
MRVHPETRAELDNQSRARRDHLALRCGWGDGEPPPAPVPVPAAWIVGLATGAEQPEELRARCIAAYAAYNPLTPTEAALTDQAIMAQLEIQRIHKVRAALRAEKVRTALDRFEEEQKEELERCAKLFREDHRAGLMAARRFALGARTLIGYWEQLGQKLQEDDTWYGDDVGRAITLLGYSGLVEELYRSEKAYWVYVWATAAQADPCESQIAMIKSPEVKPSRIQQMNTTVWPLDRDESRAKLQKLVQDELADWREIEVDLRTRHEEPARAKAVERALARVTRDEQHLLQELRSHERSLLQAHKALTGRGGKPR